MYPSSSGSLDGFFGLIFAGGAIYLVISLALVFIGYYIFYRIVRAAVRDGMVEAHIRTGGFGSGGGSASVPAYSAVQVGAPAAPTYRGPGAQQ